MKNRLLFFSALFIVVLYLSCRKNDHEFEEKFKNSFIDSAVQYLNSNLDKSEFNELDLNSIQVFKDNGRNEIFKIYTINKADNKYVILAKPKNKFLGNWAQYLNHSSNTNSSNQGIIKTESFNSRIKSEFWFTNNQVVKIVRTINGETRTMLIPSETGNLTLRRGVSSNSISIGVQNTEDDFNDYYVLPTVTVTAYVNNTPVNFYSTYWSLNQNNYYAPSYTNSPYTYGGGSSSGSGTSNTVNLPIQNGPDDPVSITDEIKCLGTGTNPNTQYFLKINVNEPNPGTRNKVSLLNDFHAGHTYITLEQRNPDGTNVSRNVGFYPLNGVKPGAETGPAVFGDDTSTPYSVAVTISVSASELQTVKQFLINQTRYSYDLQKFNCATAIVDAFSSINVQLPRTFGEISGPGSMPPEPPSHITLFKGLNPGDLGEDIRSLDANTFSAQNGYRQVTIEKYSNNDHYRSKVGNCP